MAVNMPPIRRTMKNVMHNYTDAQVKVREATSNDPWGPSSTLMSEVADLTYNVVAYSEIMQMIWKRLNDHGKNWRHVYKALVLLDYLIKTGSEKVAQQCKENIFAIQTLKDFQYTENNKDQGVNVREKAKQLVSLLKDDERLKNERARALKAKERFAQNTSGIGSDSTHGRSEERKTAGSFDENHSSSSAPAVDIEAARPSTVGEEELQLQLALAMSKEEAEQQERLQKGDDLRLKMALTKSEEESKTTPPKSAVQNQPPATQQPSLLDLDLSLSAPASDPWAPHQATAIAPPQPAAAADPWSSPIPPPVGASAAVGDPWLPNAAPPAPRTETKVDPWITSMPVPPATQVSPPPPAPDPFAPAPTVNGENDFDMISQRPNTASQMLDSSPGLGSMDAMMRSLPTYNQISVTDGPTRTRTPEHFLGEHTSLVNLDALITKSESSASTNPFATSVSQPQNNPFHTQQQPKVPMNRMVRDPLAQSFTPTAAGSALPEPLLPVGGNDNQQQQKSAATNPFL